MKAPASTRLNLLTMKYQPRRKPLRRARNIMLYAAPHERDSKAHEILGRWHDNALRRGVKKKT